MSRLQKSSVNNRDAWHDRYLNQFYKTEMCRFMLNGRCKKGDACSHAHSEGELRAKPDLSKTRMCQSLLQKGACSDRKRCPYAHDIRQIRSTNAFFKTKMCSFYESGCCKLGSKCRYAHGQSDLGPDDLSNGDNVEVVEHSHLGDHSSSKVSSASTTLPDLDHDCRNSSRHTCIVGHQDGSEELFSPTQDSDTNGRERYLRDSRDLSSAGQPGLLNYPGYYFINQVNAPYSGASPPQLVYSPYPVPNGFLPFPPPHTDVGGDINRVVPVPAPYMIPCGPYHLVPVTQQAHDHFRGDPR